MPLISPNDSVKTTKSDPQQMVFQVTSPKFSISELILSKETFDEIETVIKAKEYWNKVFEEWNLKSVMKQRRNLFINLFGEPGTGKTMAAHAIANELHKQMICVNYADIESKYVGETSKNLTKLFQDALTQDVIIFFDEADALLSKRVTNMSSSTDVSVNQTRSVLLTLLNDYTGMVIFATNFISNYDPAFMRRIQYHIKFDLPDEKLRNKLWRRYIPSDMPTDADISELADKYSGISGSDISNAVLKAALKAAKDDEKLVPQKYFEETISNIIESKTANSGNVTTVTKVNEEEVPEDIRERKRGKSI